MSVQLLRSAEAISRAEQRFASLDGLVPTWMPPPSSAQSRAAARLKVAIRRSSPASPDEMMYADDSRVTPAPCLVATSTGAINDNQANTHSETARNAAAAKLGQSTGLATIVHDDGVQTSTQPAGSVTRHRPRSFHSRLPVAM